MINFYWIAGLFLLPLLAHAAPPQDPKARQLYDHCRGWLVNFPASYVATNIRGEGNQYMERRQAALDLLREKRDFGTVYDLMTEIARGNVLSESIIDVLVEWKSQRTLPLLQTIALDSKRPKALREKAQAAVQTLSSLKPEPAPKF